MAGLIRKNYPQCKIFFLGRTYTKEVIALSEHVDEFINYDEIEKLDFGKQAEELKKYSADVIVHVFPKKEIAQLAKNAGIPLRVGTTNRLYHWLTCNKLIKLSRKNSDLHEAQLNFKLLSFLEINTDVVLNEVYQYYGFTKAPQLNEEFKSLIDKSKCNVILHPKSKGSAREWGLDNFQNLISLLPKEKYKIFVSGTEPDGKLMKQFLANNKEVIDVTGKFSLQQFIAFINVCDALVAASTGPLHISASMGKKAIGVYAPMRPIHPGRWMPIGKDAHYLVLNKNCSDCRQNNDCHCIREINAKQIVDLLEQNERI
jgi:ADP-heptose:LPS heptosyltransferase